MSLSSLLRRPKAVLRLTTADTGDRRLYEGRPRALFRASGLWLWGATDETLIHSIRSSQYIEIAISSVPLPGLFFEAGMSFEVFETLILTRDEFLCNREPLRPSHHGSKRWTFEELARLPPARPHQYITMSTVETGQMPALDISGPLTHAVLWGDCVT